MITIDKTTTYDEAISEINRLLADLEHNAAQSLEELMQKTARTEALIKYCQDKLREQFPNG